MRPKQRQDEFRVATFVVDDERAASQPEIANLPRPEAGLRLNAVAHHSPGKFPRHSAHPQIVIVQIGDPRLDEALQQLGFCLGDPVERVEKLQVHRVYIRDDAFVRFRDLRQPSNLALRGHAHFEHRHLLRGFHAQQAQGQAKLVVQVSHGSQYGKFSAQNCSDHFPGCGLAGAACHSNDRPRPLPPHNIRQTLKGCECRCDANGAESRRRLNVFFDDGSCGIPFDRLSDEIVAVKAWALDREEQFSSFQSPGVDGVALNLHIRGPRHGAAHRFSDFVEPQVHEATPAPRRDRRMESFGRR